MHKRVYDNKEDDSDLAKLIHDFRCSNANDMLLEPLASRTRYFKETPEGVEYMCKAMEERLDKRDYNVRLTIVIKMIKDGKLTDEEIAAYTEFTVEKIRSLREELKSEPA